MYSLLLMTALATGGDTASFGGRFGGCTGGGCTGYTSCSGCTGYVAGCGGCTGYTTSCSGCTGYVASCTGCTGYSCTGSTCCGGSGILGLRAHFAKHNSCHGSCTGSSCCGGYGSSCCGGWGACYGGSCTGCTGCGGTVIYGTSLAPAASASSYTIGSMQTPAFRNWEMSPRVSGVNYNGAYYAGENYAAYPNGVGVRTFSPGYTYGGGYSTGVVGPYFYGADFRPYVPQGPIPGTLANPLYVPGAPAPVMIPEFEAAKATPKVSAPANLIVNLPADAKFYVDGMLTKGEGTTRNFHTPELPQGKTFFYDLKAEVTVEGKLIVENKRVLVRGGEDVTESFPKLLAAAKASSKEPTAIASTK